MKIETERILVGRRHPKSNAQGFTFFELVLAIVISALLATTLANRLLKYRELAEKTAMEYTVNSLQSALNIRMAALIARGHGNEAITLLNLNPFTLLATNQKNYLGEYYDARSVEMASGSWYYDLSAKEVIYLVRKTESFESGINGDKRIRFKVTLIYNEVLPSEKMRSDKDIGGVALREVEAYKWKIQ